jgi:uncharacterized protein
MFSATHVAAFLACHHLSTLDRQQTEGLIEKPFFADPTIELLRELGARHEQDYLRYLTGVRKLDVAEVPTDISWDEATIRTNDGLRRGVGAIYQATLQVGSWHGRSDFLIRVRQPSSLGNWSYQPVEAKLARSTKVGALIQLCFYSDLLAQIQGVTPERMHVVLGLSTEPEQFSVKQYLAYFRKIKRDFEKAYEMNQATYPEPTEHCNVCSWDTVCDKRWRSDDYLSLVAGITRTQRKSLSNREVTTVARLAQLDLKVSPKFDGIRPSTLSRLHDQANLQVKGRTEGHVIFRLLDATEPNEGLWSLPLPSQWDVFLDLEGDPFALGHGIEYLVGMLTLEETLAARPTYQPLWSLDLTEEKESFAKLIGTIIERWRGHPEMHVYHYASYEPTAIKRLAGRHGICIDEVDELLRAGVFFDLYRVVKQGMRASVESYSLKKIEALYNFPRAVSPRDSVVVLQAFGTAFALGSSPETLSKLLPTLEAYNQDDCLSAWKLREWLEDRRRELEAKTSRALPRPGPREGAPTEGLAEQIEQVRALMDRLQSGIPTNEADWTPEHRTRWLLAQILEYYRREDKSSWWEYFRQCALSDEEVLEDGNAMGGLVYVGPITQVKKSTVHRYKFPPQDHTIDRALNIHDPLTKAGAGTVVSIDDGLGHIDIKRSSSSAVPHPTALIPYNFVDPRAKRDSLVRLGEWVANHDITADGPFQAARDLLRRRPPRELPVDAEAFLDSDGQITDQARKMIQSLCSQPAVLPLQGPPGSGKTHTGARMIAEVVRNGYRAGITAVSHKVISKLLQDTCEYCRAESLQLRAVQKGNDDDCCADNMVTQADDNDDVSTALTSRTAQLAAGTAWLWARAEMANSVDVLFVDEAGQMSLADVLSISQAARSVVLLGDPQQLNQPQKGIHPPGVDVSALGHLLDGRATIENGKGIFLNETYRLHPDICTFISELFYDNRLMARPENANQRLYANGLLDGSGLRFLTVEHFANQTKSPEEVAEIVELVSGLLRGTAAWVNKAGETNTLTLDDILVVAPYNAQVSALLQALPDGARVGTVDKFQGQQAPVVFYSMTTSTPEEAPRGMEFLYSLNRLNVAVSRAQCLAVVVASPALFQVECKSPHQMQLANALCRYVEMAKGAL